MIITIAHTKGGVGKSTLAWHLAHSYKDEKVTVIDLDFQQTLHYINLLSHKNLHVIQSQSVSQLILQLEQIKKDDICIIDVGGNYYIKELDFYVLVNNEFIRLK